MKVYLLSAEEERIKTELERIGVDSYAFKMVKKSLPLNILIRGVKSPAANIIKQEAIASGMDAAVKRGVVSCSVELSDVLLMGSQNHYPRIIKRLSAQPFGLNELSHELKRVLGSKKSGKIFARDKVLSYEERPLVMGILNVTPDSFSDGGKYLEKCDIESRVDQIISDGADIIDIGGMSSRPGADIIEAKEEIARIDYALGYSLSKGAVVSVDTMNEETAAHALKHGAHIINDITGLKSDKMAEKCAEYSAGVCLMHMRGVPKDMQRSTEYGNIFFDIFDFFEERLEKAYKIGISHDNIILDVGFGFGKSLNQNYVLLKYLKEFDILKLPMLAGISKKSMLGDVVGRGVEERASATVAANMAALMNGADIIRVHDVKGAVDCAKIYSKMRKATLHD